MMVLKDVKYIYYLNHPNKSISDYNKKRNNLMDAIQRINYFEQILKQLGIGTNNGVYNREVIDTLLSMYYSLDMSQRKFFKANYNKDILSSLRHKVKIKGVSLKYFIKAVIVKSSMLSYVYLRRKKGHS